MSLVKRMGVLLFILGISVSIIAACAGGDQGAQEPPGTQEPGPDQTDQTADEDDELVAQGEEVVQQTCISCHGQNLEGGYGPTLQGIGERYSEEEIMDILVNGKGNMSGGLAQGHEEAVIAYLKTVE